MRVNELVTKVGLLEHEKNLWKHYYQVQCETIGKDSEEAKTAYKQYLKKADEYNKLWLSEVVIKE